MLEMAFNEINPYRENRMGLHSQIDSSSVTMNVGPKGYTVTNEDSLGGGSMQVMNQNREKLLTNSDGGREETYESAR